MARSVTRERELRSLERPGLRHAFRPLDAGERLPRELVIDPGIAASGIGRRVIALLVPAAFLAVIAVLVLTLR